MLLRGIARILTALLAVHETEQFMKQKNRRSNMADMSGLHLKTSRQTFLEDRHFNPLSAPHTDEGREGELTREVEELAIDRSRWSRMKR